MKKEFTVTGNCVPAKHYMADTSEKLAAVMALVEKGNYFSINCPRQYGKTTMLSLLSRSLPKEYTPIRISFEGAADKMFEDESGFCQGLLDRCKSALERRQYAEAEFWEDDSVTDFNRLSGFLTKTCRDKKYVLMIDEVDKSSNNIIFLKFLGVLREKYLLRNDGEDDTFQSVILAGVYDIKNLKIKIHQTGHTELKDGEARINSPWNIAVDFKVDMSLSVKEISSMLADYENDHHTGMDIETVAREIRAYTNGYPYLVSRICMKIEDDLDKDWTPNGVRHAVKEMLLVRTTLVDDVAKNLDNHEKLNDMIFDIIARGEGYTYSATDPVIGLGLTFGYLVRKDQHVAIANRFFEMLFYRQHILTLERSGNAPDKIGTAGFIAPDGKLNVPLVIEKFTKLYYELYRDKQKKFLEAECRMIFIAYIQPIINGYGFYHVESETRDAQRTDVIVDYGAEQFIIELKIWRGEVRHEDALDQIAGYLDSKNKDVGYLLTFDFRKNDNTGEPRMEWVEHGGKRIFDVMVGV